MSEAATKIIDAEFEVVEDKVSPLPESAPKPTPPHIFMSILCMEGKVYEANVASRDELKLACVEANVSLSISRNAGTGVDRSRNQEVAKFLANPSYTHLLFVDADISFHPNHVLYMLKASLDPKINAGVVAAAYPRKQIDWESVVLAVKRGITAEELPKYATTFILNGFSGKGFSGEYGTFAEVKELGTGFMLIKREVLEAVLEANRWETAYLTDYPPLNEIHHMIFKCDRDPDCRLEKAKDTLLSIAKNFFTISDNNTGKLVDAAAEYGEAIKGGKDSLGRYLTEDYRFCRLVEQLGYKVILYMDASIHHIGVMTFEGEIRAGMKVDPVDSGKTHFEVVSE